MLVVDSRADASTVQQPGLNRSDALTSITTSNPPPIEKQTEEHTTVIAMHTSAQTGPSEAARHPGVLVVDKTPGQDALVSMLLKRVWGIGDE